jgi:group I intron endonuclease
MIINKALYNYDYSAFNLTIIEHIDVFNLFKNEAKVFILMREQHYLDTLEPEYNILKVAGSSLGFKHSEESRALRS